MIILINRICRVDRSRKSAGLLRSVSSILVAIIVMNALLLSFSSVPVRAEIVANATVAVTSANVRNAPGTVSTVIGTLTYGTRISVIETVAITGDPNGYNSWYKIRATIAGVEQEGYIVSGFVQKDPVTTDPAFEEKIAGFPESYKRDLRSLHELHPAWNFIPVPVTSDWTTVVAEEAKIGRSLITSSADDSWKSVETGTYNWLTNTYTPYDGTNWVNASKDVVAYYLDPRNFMNETYVFQFLNLSYDPATQNAEAVQKVLNGTFMATAAIKDAAGADISYAQTFMQAAAASGSSPYQLVSRVIQEVSPTGSRSVSGTEPGFEGYYNFYNIGAASSPDPVILGLNFAKFGTNNPANSSMPPDKQALYSIPWNSPYRSIVGGAVYISGTYLQKGQYTPYFQKFDVTDGGNGMFTHQYMTNIQAMVNESTTLYKAYARSGLLDASLTFHIPVYAGMPEAAIAQPPKTGNPNNYLSALSVSGYALTPTFSPEITEGYSLIVPYQTASIDLQAKTIAATSTMQGTGTIALNPGINELPIKVTAQNGTTRTYSLTIVRNEPTGEDLYATTLRIGADNTVSGITPQTSLETIAGTFALHNEAKLNLVDVNGVVVTDRTRLAVTGDRIQILNRDNVLTYEYTVIIFGDANRDGKISSSDLTLICRHVLKENTLTGPQALSSDANHDGKISSSDLTVICRHVLGQSVVTQ